MSQQRVLKLLVARCLALTLRSAEGRLVGEAYNQFGPAVGVAGLWDEKKRRSIELAISVGASREGAVRSHTRRGLKAGISPKELD